MTAQIAIMASIITALVTVSVAVLGATVFQAAKQAVERDANVRHSLLVLDGSLRNISRHYIRTGGRLANPAPVDGLTLTKAKINIEYTEEQFKEIIKTVASSRITFGLQQIILLLRNYNIEIDELTKTTQGAPLSSVAVDQSKVPRIQGIGLFLAQACHTAAEDIKAYRMEYTKRNYSIFYYPVRHGTTPIVERIDEHVQISTVRKRKSDLLKMCDDYLDGEDDKDNRVRLQKYICDERK